MSREPQPECTDDHVFYWFNNYYQCYFNALWGRYRELRASNTPYVAYKLVMREYDAGAFSPEW